VCADHQFGTTSTGSAQHQTPGNSLNVGLRAGYFSVGTACASERRWLKARRMQPDVRMTHIYALVCKLNIDCDLMETSK